MNPLQILFFCTLWGVRANWVLCAVFGGQIYNTDCGQPERWIKISGIVSIYFPTPDPFSSHINQIQYPANVDIKFRNVETSLLSCVV